MPQPHVIRLRGPWEASVAGEGASRVKLPAAWDDVLRGAAGPVTLSRSFHRPTVLPEFERVRLCVRSPHDVQGLWLNDAALGVDSERHDVTAKLNERNVLEVELYRGKGDSRASLLEAWLEIEEQRA